MNESIDINKLYEDKCQELERMRDFLAFFTELAEKESKFQKKLLDKCFEYEQKRKDGLLLEFPYKIGDTAYINQIDIAQGSICQNVASVKITKYIQDSFHLIVEFKTEDERISQLCAEYVYKTPEEAEQALKERSE